MILLIKKSLHAQSQPYLTNSIREGHAKAFPGSRPNCPTGVDILRWSGLSLDSGLGLDLALVRGIERQRSTWFGLSSGLGNYSTPYYT